jgi:hypothetical protein
MSYMKSRGSYAMGSTPSFGMSLAPIKSLEELRAETFDEMEFAPVDVNVPSSSWLQTAKDKGAELVAQASKKPTAPAKKSAPTWHWLVLAGVIVGGVWWLSKNYSV